MIDFPSPRDMHLFGATAAFTASAQTNQNSARNVAALPLSNPDTVRPNQFLQLNAVSSGSLSAFQDPSSPSNLSHIAFASAENLPSNSQPLMPQMVILNDNQSSTSSVSIVSPLPHLFQARSHTESDTRDNRSLVYTNPVTTSISSSTSNISLLIQSLIRQGSTEALYLLDDERRRLAAQFLHTFRGALLGLSGSTISCSNFSSSGGLGETVRNAAIAPAAETWSREDLEVVRSMRDVCSASERLFSTRSARGEGDIHSSLCNYRSDHSSRSRIITDDRDGEDGVESVGFSPMQMGSFSQSRTSAGTNTSGVSSSMNNSSNDSGSINAAISNDSDIIATVDNEELTRNGEQVGMNVDRVGAIVGQLDVSDLVFSVSSMLPAAAEVPAVSGLRRSSAGEVHVLFAGDVALAAAI